MLDAPVQDYYKENCAKWGVDWSDFLTPIVVNLGSSVLGVRSDSARARARVVLNSSRPRTAGR